MIKLKNILALIPTLFLIVLLSYCNNNPTDFKYSTGKSDSLYKECKLKGKLSYEVFCLALQGLSNIKEKVNKDIITIIDYSKASTEKRLFIIALKETKILHHSLVAHGKGTGNNYAKKFSNKAGSKCSSEGFFLTEETYSGKHGYSLKLKGLEKGINDNARSRAIVIHGADYVSNSFINKYGRLGRSWGCPALPSEETKSIINTIKSGTIIFIYSGEDYIKKSELV